MRPILPSPRHPLVSPQLGNGLRLRLTWAVALVLALLPAGTRAGMAQELTLREALSPGCQYRVATRTELSGQLSLPEQKGQAPKPLPVTGTSIIDYEERVLAGGRDGVEKTLRLYHRMDFARKVGDQQQKNSLRDTVHRLVLLRRATSEVPFSPDGPLLLTEIDMVRTDVFTPALTGLLPDRPVRPGDRWKAASPAVHELTDMEHIDEGGLECRLEGVEPVQGRRQARVSFSGTVRGTNEDGPNRQQIDGSFFFDLESHHLSYLTLRGVHSLLGKDGQESGRIEGNFVLTRQANIRSAGLADEALRGLTLEPGTDNTMLLHDSPELGLTFLYPRRWRAAGGAGRQVRLDAPGGAGLVLTLETTASLPTVAAFQGEARGYFESQKGRVSRASSPERLQGPPQEIDRFTLEVELGGQPLVMDYYLLRQAERGATVAARLPVADQAALQAEVNRIARSISLRQPAKNAR